MTTFNEGQSVQTVEPIHLHGQSFFFPGEELFIVSAGKGDVRVRCPASGEDAWINPVSLVASPPAGVTWSRWMQATLQETEAMATRATGLRADYEALWRLVNNFLTGNFDVEYLRASFSKLTAE